MNRILDDVFGVINGQEEGSRDASHVIIICGGVGKWGTCGSEVNFRSMFQYHIELLRKGTIIYTSTFAKRFSLTHAME